MRPLRLLFVLSLVSALFVQPVVADTLLVESVNAASDVHSPGRGMTMDQVLQGWGEPQQRVGPVGEPPISHWVYADFRVYFEGNHVLHSVVPHGK